MIDDLTPLHQLENNLNSQSFFLYKPDKAFRVEQSEDDKTNLKLVGKNPLLEQSYIFILKI